MKLLEQSERTLECEKTFLDLKSFLSPYEISLEKQYSWTESINKNGDIIIVNTLILTRNSKQMAMIGLRGLVLNNGETKGELFLYLWYPKFDVEAMEIESLKGMQNEIVRFVETLGIRAK